MSIKLEYILKRNNSNLQTFVKKNKLTSYALLLEYCETRKFLPCTEEEYDGVVKKVNQIKLVGKLVKHRDKKNVGIVVKSNKIHPSYLTVLTKGKLVEWHILSVETDN